MIELRRSADRGVASFGWLKSKHSFSFGRYYDPAQMGFSALRVINDDEVDAAAGFDTHGHQDMEIISYVLQGQLAHRDSAGHVKTLPAGEFQLMSAGKGRVCILPSSSNSTLFCEVNTPCKLSQALLAERLSSLASSSSASLII